MASSSSCPRFFPLSLPGVLAWDSDPLMTTSFSKTDFSYFLFPLTEEGGYFRFWDSSQSFGFYLLPSPVRRFVRATICPCTPFFTHPVTKYKHLLVSILTWICYLRNWPRFLFQRSVLGLLIQIRRHSSNPPLLLFQWETTWHYIMGMLQYDFLHHTTCESTCDTLTSSAANQGDNTVSVAQGGTATPSATKQLLLPDRVFKRNIYLYTQKIN